MHARNFPASVAHDHSTILRCEGRVPYLPHVLLGQIQRDSVHRSQFPCGLMKGWKRHTHKTVTLRPKARKENPNRSGLIQFVGVYLRGRGGEAGGLRGGIVCKIALFGRIG